MTARYTDRHWNTSKAWRVLNNVEYFDTYAYDAAGNRTKTKVTGQSPWTATYLYDANNRLISESSNKGGQHTTVYPYDDNGNLTSAATGLNTTTYTCNTFNQLNGAAAATAGILSRPALFVVMGADLW